MIKIRHLVAVLRARNREFIRDRSTWAWNLIFPVVLIAGLAFVFGDGNKPVYTVGVHPAMNTTDAFFETRHIQFVVEDNLDTAIAKVDRHQYDLVLDVETQRYWINDTSPKGYFAERVLLAASLDNGATSAAVVPNYQRQAVSGKAIRYVDWVLPGVLGMNMMFSCLFGVGYVIVRYRKAGVLKRLKATPLRAFEFVTAQVLSRLWLVMAVTLVVFLGTHWFLNFTVNGSYLSLLIVFLVGAVSLISLGLLVASYTSSEELAGGMLNVASWPMMILSGVWFSLEGAHPLMQRFADLLPLTHIITAAREIMIDGASLFMVWGHVAYLALAAVVFTSLSAWLFKWE